MQNDAFFPSPRTATTSIGIAHVTSSARSGAPDPLLVDSRTAAGMLSICPKSLWSETDPRGPIPCVRIGRRVLYSVEALREWIATQQKRGESK